jgi:hypothetical protein
VGPVLSRVPPQCRKHDETAESEENEQSPVGHIGAGRQGIHTDPLLILPALCSSVTFPNAKPVWHGRRQIAFPCENLPPYCTGSGTMPDGIHRHFVGDSASFSSACRVASAFSVVASVWRLLTLSHPSTLAMKSR